MEPSDLHAQVETAFNNADVDRLVGLYDAQARMVKDDGSVAEGLDAIREIWAGFVALGGRIRMTTRYAAKCGDTALLSNAWVFKADGIDFSSTTAEVARLQPDGDM
jgi:ketosteroid isomerase-like protein